MKIISARKASLPLLLVPVVFVPLSAIGAEEQTMIVSATPQTVSELDTPAAVSVVNGDDMRHATPRINLSESLGSVPGLQIQNRQNYAQDLQLSVRGFGARSTFGVRGIRMYVDGIPATMPDGQGQTSNIDLSSIDSVEVLRGPFSALYGNASGGVINMTTQTGQQPPTLEASSYYGSYGTWRYGMKATGAMGDGTHAGDVDYTVSTTRFTTKGFRDHSGARKNLANAKLGVRIDDASKLTLIFNSVDMKANDPGGLSYQEWQNNPRQSPRGDQYNTRKTIKQTQAGLRYDRQLSAQDDLSVMMYAGEREMTQYQSIPYQPQLRPSHSGGVIDMQRHYQGVDTRWTHRGELLVPVTFTTGLNYENMSEDRRGYENFVMNNGVPDYGVKGDKRRDERNLMWNVDPYLQTSWQLTQKLSVDAGVRYSSVWFDSNDHYVTPGNGDDSGDASYHKWLPAGSVKYAVTDAWNLYAAAGRGFETPTINELSYRADNQGDRDASRRNAPIHRAQDALNAAHARRRPNDGERPAMLLHRNRHVHHFRVQRVAVARRHADLPGQRLPDFRAVAVIIHARRQFPRIADDRSRRQNYGDAAAQRFAEALAEPINVSLRRRFPCVRRSGARRFLQNALKCAGVNFQLFPDFAEMFGLHFLRGVQRKRERSQRGQREIRRINLRNQGAARVHKVSFKR